MNKKEDWIYDIEQYPNFHSAFFINKNTNEEQFFIIHPELDQRKEYLKFLNERVRGLIGFNNLNYDSKIINCFIENYNRLDLIDILYRKNQYIINEEKIYEKDLIPQLDLFCIHHYNNKARRTSLKWIEYYLQMDNIVDLPIKPGTQIFFNDFELIKSYNRNDVLATKKFYEYTVDINAVKLRKDISKQFGFNCLNLSDVAIGAKINQIYYSNITGKNYRDYKDDRTFRKIIVLNDCIPSFIKFETEQLKKMLYDIKNTVITGTKNQMTFNIKLGNNIFVIKNGGLHTKDEPKYIKPLDDEYLGEMDVGSMYPRIIITNKLYPKHLGIEWLKGYETITEERLLAKKEGNSTKSDALKLALNGGGFGKTNEKYSWMYDPLTK